MDNLNHTCINGDNKVSRISIFLPSLQGGGAERVMVSLANGFAQRGFSVDLVLVKAEGVYLPLVSDQVRVIDLNCSRVLTSLIALNRYISTEKPYVILSTLDHANVTAIVARALTRGPQRIVVRVANNISNQQKNIKGIRNHLTGIVVRHIYNWADQIIAVSQGVADDLVESYSIPHSLVKTIYNPAITPELLNKSLEPLDHPWFRLGEPPVIVGMGRLTPAKDFTTLIHAFAHLTRNHIARLLILGEGEDRKKLESLIKDLELEQQVMLPGFIDNPVSYIKQAAVFVLSSRFEGMPNSLLQAMACGTPVVSTDCPSGPREILESGKWGKLVPVGNVEAMAEAIAASLKGETQQPSVEILESRFGLDIVLNQYLSILVGSI
jgi:glycosyltransferase involved in cell wall biosynthesis